MCCKKIISYFDKPGTLSKKKVPAKIQQAFIYNFPNIKKAKWRIEEADLYAADFIDINNENVSAYFNSEGVLVELSILKSFDKLNASLIKKINSQFNSTEIEDIIEVRDYYNDEIFYVVNIVKDNERAEKFGKMMLSPLKIFPFTILE